MSAPSASSLYCLCLNITTFSPRLQLACLSAGVIFFFLLCGWVEESILSSSVLPNFMKFKYLGWWLTFMELATFATIAAVERGIRGQRMFGLSHPLYKHALVGLAMTVSRGLTNLSMQYLNYPTQVIFKSLKLLVVMLGGVALLRKSFQNLQYVAALLFGSSALFFSLGDSSVSPNFNVLGVVIVCCSLIGDSFHSNMQEWLLKNIAAPPPPPSVSSSSSSSSSSTTTSTHGTTAQTITIVVNGDSKSQQQQQQHQSQASNDSQHATLLETMLFTNLFGAVCSLLVVLLSGDLTDALDYCSTYPLSYPLFIFRSFIIYGGVLCLMSLFQRFDAVVGTIVTTFRKVLTIVASFIIFPKPMSMQYVYGLLVFVLAVVCEIRARSMPSSTPTPQASSKDEAETSSTSTSKRLLPRAAVNNHQAESDVDADLEHQEGDDARAIEIVPLMKISSNMNHLRSDSLEEDVAVGEVETPLSVSGILRSNSNASQTGSSRHMTM